MNSFYMYVHLLLMSVHARIRLGRHPGNSVMLRDTVKYFGRDQLSAILLVIHEVKDEHVCLTTVQAKHVL
jgi:hypothetical protein